MELNQNSTYNGDYRYNFCWQGFASAALRTARTRRGVPWCRHPALPYGPDHLRSRESILDQLTRLNPDPQPDEKQLASKHHLSGTL